MGMGEKGGEVTYGPEVGQKGPSIIISLEQKSWYYPHSLSLASFICLPYTMEIENSFGL